MANQAFYTTDAGGSTVSTTSRESFSDEITIFSPMDTPLQMLLPKEDVSNIRHSWMTDDIATPTSISTEKEGFQYTDLARDQTERVRLYNDVMITGTRVEMANSRRTQNQAGIAEEFAYQLAKGYATHAKQVETNLWYSTYQARTSPAVGSTAIGASGTEGQSTGFLQWAVEAGIPRAHGYTGEDQTVGPNTTLPESIWTNWYHVGTTGSAGGGTSRFDFNTSTLTQDNLIDDVMTPVWEFGGDIDACVMFVSAQMKKHLTETIGITFTPSGSEVALQRSNIAAESRKRVITVDTYATDIGDLHVAKCRYLTSSFTDLDGTIEHSSANDTYSLEMESVGFAIDPRYACIPVYRPTDWEGVAKDGDSTKAFIRSEVGVKVNTPQAVWGFSGGLSNASD